MTAGPTRERGVTGGSRRIPEEAPVWFPDDVQHLQALSALASRWVAPSARARHLTPLAAGRPAGDGRDPSPSSHTGPVPTR